MKLRKSLFATTQIVLILKTVSIERSQFVFGVNDHISLTNPKNILIEHI